MIATQVPITFDYTALDIETRIQVQQRASEIKALGRKVAADISEMGGKFAEVRDLLRHNKTGGFEGWIDTEGFKKRFVYRCLAVHEMLSNRANLAQLDVSLSALYLLAENATPEEARAELIARAEAGEVVTYGSAKALIDDYKPQPAARPALLPPAPVAPMSDEAWDKLADTDEPPPVAIEDRILYRGKPARVIGVSGSTLTLRETDGAIRIFRPTEDEPIVKICFPGGGFGTCPNCNQVAAWTASEDSPGLLECGLCVHECSVDEIMPIAETHPRAAEAMLGKVKHFAYCPDCGTCHAKWQPHSDERWVCKACGTFVADALMQVFERDAIPTTGSKEWMVARLAVLGMNVYRVVKHQDGTFTAAFDLNGRYTEAEAADAAARHGRAIVEAGFSVVKAGVNIDSTLYFTGQACPMVHFAIDAVTFGEAMRGKLERIAEENYEFMAMGSTGLDDELGEVDASTAEADDETPSVDLSPGWSSRLNSGMNSSNTPEWYTPADLMERARKALWGRIDLDPASCAAANQIVQARRYFDRETDGLSQEWKADTLWLNPPYGSEIRPWIEKLLTEAKAKRTLEALVLLPARTDTEWFRLLRDYPRVFLYGRQAFWNESSAGNPAPFPSVIVGIGLVPEALERYFGDIGDVFVHFKEKR